MIDNTKIYIQIRGSKLMPAESAQTFNTVLLKISTIWKCAGVNYEPMLDAYEKIK